MKRLAQEARKRQGVVKYALKHGQSKAARMYGVSLSSVKRWMSRFGWSAFFLFVIVLIVFFLVKNYNQCGFLLKLILAAGALFCALISFALAFPGRASWGSEELRAQIGEMLRVKHILDEKNKYITKK